MSPKEGMFWAGFIGTTAAIAFLLQHFFEMNRLLSALCGAVPGMLVGGLLQRFYENQMRKTRAADPNRDMAKSTANCQKCSWEGDPQMSTNCPICGAPLKAGSHNDDEQNPFRF